MERSENHSDNTNTDSLSVLHVNGGIDNLMDDTQKKTSTIILWFNREFAIYSGSFITWALLIGSILVTKQLWEKSETEALQNLQNHFTTQVQKSVDTIEKRIVSLEYLLIAVNSYFSHNRKITSEDYRSYIRGLSWKNVRNIRFSPIVLLNDKTAYMNQLQYDGFSKFKILPAGERPFYIPIEYSSDENDHLLGYDLYAPPSNTKKKSYQKVIDSALVSWDTAIPEITLPFGDEDTTALTMFRAVYKNDSHPHQLMDVIGIASLSFNIRECMAEAFGNTLESLDIQIYDGFSEKPFYESPKRNIHSLFHETRTLEVGGRIWRVSVRSLPEFENAVSQKKSQIIGIAWGLINIFLTFLVGILVYQHNQTIHIAENESNLSEQLKKILKNLSRYNESINEYTLISATDAQGRILEVNEQFCRVSQYERHEIIGKTHQMFKSGVHPREFYDDLWETITNGNTWRNEVCNRKKDGSLYWADVHIIPMKNENLEIIGYVAIRTDISKYKEEERKLLESASHDALTGLPNRLLLMDRLNQAIIQAQRNHRQWAVLFVDLDRFKPINDTFWHAVGDQLLKEVSRKMNSIVRHEDTVARHGWDEFIIILSEITHPEDARIIAEKIVKILAEPHQINEEELSIGASIGISIFPKDGSSADILIQKSDAAMYQAKKSGRNTYRFF